ncbi:MAG TPA: hypothetical protein VF009_05580 [Solirubrobacterales bacterium]
MEVRILEHDRAGEAQPTHRAVAGWLGLLVLVPTGALLGKMIESAAAGIEGYERLHAPTLGIRGRSTSPWLWGVAGQLAREMPAARLVELDGGHACILKRPEDFVAALGSHITGAEGVEAF